MNIVLIHLSAFTIVIILSGKYSHYRFGRQPLFHMFILVLKLKAIKKTSTMKAVENIMY